MLTTSRLQELFDYLPSGQLVRKVSVASNAPAGDSLDNRIENLRPCENTENAWNSRISKANTSGVKGVSWNPLSSTWRVRVRANGRNMSLGCFDDFELAELVSIEARAKHHGAFANAH